MIIYLDLVIFVNFFFDFLLLLTVNITLKRYSKIYKIIISAITGNISLITLFINFNTISLIVFKVLLALMMVIIAFGYKTLKYTIYNLTYFYMTSIILGGFLYYLKLEFNYSNNSLYYHNISVPYLFLVIISPLILYIFIRSIKALKIIKNYYYQVVIIFENNYKITMTGFLDTGNTLKDPVTKKSIIILDKRVIKGKFNIRSPMYIPFNTIKGHSMLECIKPKLLEVNGIIFNNYLIGFSNKISANGIDCLLNYEMEDKLCLKK